MSALVERIIAARDQLKRRGQDVFLPEVLDAMADAANAINERDQTIHALRTRLAHVEAFSTIELQNCARYVNEGRDSSEAATRGRELARMVLYVGRPSDD